MGEGGRWGFWFIELIELIGLFFEKGWVGRSVEMIFGMR